MRSGVGSGDKKYYLAKPPAKTDRVRLGLSVLGMIAAALGLITPVQGAIFQEVIDIAVILNALRALHDRSV